MDAATGAPCADFGKDGQVSLRDVPRYDPGWYHMTSPPAIIDDLAVVGSAIDDNHRVDMARGVVRAYDARTGALRWSWDPLPANPTARAVEGQGRSSRSGAGNAWSIMAVDTARDLLFVPTGSASPDYFGVVALSPAVSIQRFKKRVKDFQPRCRRPRRGRATQRLAPNRFDFKWFASLPI